VTLTTDLDTVTRWANRHGCTLRFTFHPHHEDDVCPNEVWDLTVKPGRNGADHKHFIAERLTVALKLCKAEFVS
jgi:hypothetical protein